MIIFIWSLYDLYRLDSFYFPEELRLVFSALPDPLTEEEIDEMLRVEDKNEDGHFDLDEFR